jgi:hypothetical protein
MEPVDQCINFIVERTPRAGAVFSPDLRAHAFLVLLGREIASSEDTPLFGMRQKEHVGHAVEQVGANGVLSPPAAIASFFLATRFEYYFRRLGTSLNPDGSWVSSQAKAEAQVAVRDDRLRAKRVSDVSLAYRLMLLNQTSQVVQHFAKLDQLLAPHCPRLEQVPTTHHDVGSRIALLRHPTSHGFFDDASSEGLFYGLVMGIIFYAHDA